MSLEKFDRLEEGLGRLLKGYESLQAENRELKDALEAKDSEIRELSERLQKLDREKGLIREKVDTLLNRLEGLIQGA